MEITKTVVIEINIEDLIEMYSLDKTSSTNEIRLAVCNYVEGLDDCDYYLIDDDDDILKITEEVINTLK